MMVTRRSRWELVLVVALSGPAVTGCGDELLVAGIANPPPATGGQAGGPISATGGAPGQGGASVVNPVCSGSLFASEGLAGTQLADQVTQSVVGDWNRDGVADLAVVNADLGSISVTLGKGDGTFAPRTDYATGMKPWAIAAGDLDGDRVPDLAVVNNMGASVTVFLAKGDGSFRPGTDYSIGAWPESVVIADWTNDGKNDLLAGDTLFIGHGDGTFARGVTYGYAPSSLATADLDGDGNLDLLAIQLDVAYTLIGHGDGTFMRKAALQLGEYNATPTLADLNGDRTPDLVLVGPCPNEQDSAFYLMMGAGDGTFRVTATAYEQPCGVATAVGDVNGDGKVDLQFGTQQTWLGNGDGTFSSSPRSLPANDDTLLGMADWNHDGRLDLAVSDQAFVLKTLLGDGHGDFGIVPPSYPLGPNAFGSLLADLTGDGRLDLLAIAPPNLDVLRGNGDGTFTETQPYSLPKNVTKIDVADINGDGQPDLVASGPPGTSVTVALGDGQGGLRPALALPLTGFVDAAGDMDGDGIADLVVVRSPDADFPTSSGDVEIVTAFGEEDGTFSRLAVTDTGWNRTGGTLVADLNGDGRLDAAVLSDGNLLYPSPLRRFWGNADGTFTLRDETVTPIGQTTGLAAGDLNRDGQTDLLIGDGGAVFVWLGTAGGALTTPLKSAAPLYSLNPGLLQLADVNGDGVLDVNTGAGALLGRGDGTFACDQPFTSDFYSDGALVGDLNQDGKADVAQLIGNPNAPGVAVLLSR